MLPKIQYPIYVTKLPSSGKDVKFRPFLVKEEKLLLMALSGESDSEMNFVTRQIVNNCLLDESLDTEKMPIFDIEWLFIQMRIKSVASTVDVVFSGQENSDCVQCQKQETKTVDLTKVHCDNLEGHTNKIKFNDSVGMVMKYPSSYTLSKNNEDYYDLILEIIRDCTDIIYDAENQYKVSDVSKEEFVEFIETLNSDQFAQIESFFETMPACRYDVELKCDSCGKEQTYQLRGLNDFFG